MNGKAIAALVLAILLPLTGYWIMKYYSKDAVHMPPHYFYDSVHTEQKHGKTITMFCKDWWRDDPPVNERSVCSSFLNTDM